MSEPELAKHYQISRTTLRDALSRIETCGLIERKNNIGYKVVALSTESVIQLFQVCESLEGMACRLAVQNMSADVISELKVKLKTQNQGSSTEMTNLAELEHCFHDGIVRGSNNPLLVRLLCDELYYVVAMYQNKFINRQSPKAIYTEISKYLQILQAIEENDAELAELLMRRLISATKKNIINLMEPI